MYQTGFYRQMGAAAVAAALVLAFGTEAGAQDPEKCKAAIIKNSDKYAGALLKAQQKCEEGRLKGKITTACSLDAKTQDKITKAATKLGEGIDKACTGVALVDIGFDGLVTRCAGGDRDGLRCVDAADCPDGGVCTAVDECPSYLNGGLPGDTCSAPLTVASLGSCLECTTNAKIATVIDGYYGVLNAASTDKDIAKCQLDIGKRSAKHFATVEKSLAKCEDALLKGKVVSCPDSKANDKISKSLTKLEEAIAKTCAAGATISDALNSGELYSVGSRWGDCGVTAPSTAAGLAEVLACMSSNAAACDVALSTGNPTCNGQLCGNGQIDSGETCDDGNTTNESGQGPANTCPSDCSVAACSVSGTVAVTVNLTTPVDLLSGIVLLTYNDQKVSIPGTGQDAPVQNAFSSLVFATTPNDVNYAVRVVFQDPFLIGAPSGPAFTATFNTCGGPAPTAADFGCMVVDAADTAFATITGVTCSVSL